MVFALVPLYQSFGNRTSTLVKLFLNHSHAKLAHKHGGIYDPLELRMCHTGTYVVVKKYKRDLGLVEIREFPGKEYSFIQAMTVIKVHAQWEQFCRQLILTSAYKPVLTATGQVTKPVTGLKSEIDVLNKLRNIYKIHNSYWEPNWDIPAKSIQAATRLGVSNLAAISAGFSMSGASYIPDYLSAVRNFFAHSNSYSAIKVKKDVIKNLHFPANYGTFEALNALDAAGQTLFEVWTKQLQLMAWQAIQ